MSNGDKDWETAGSERESYEVGVCNNCGKDPSAAKVGPAIEEVEAEVKARGYAVDPSKFMAYYEKNGWKRKDGSPIADWRDQLRSWDFMDRKRAAGGGESPKEPRAAGSSEPF